MSEFYNDHDLTVTAEHITVAGHATPLSDYARAEEYPVENWLRNGVILIVGVLAPIVAVIILSKTMLGDEPHDMNHAYGPAALVAVVVLGVLAGMIAKAWAKPWGVVVERKGVGFDKLCGAPSKDAAAAAAAAINKALGH
ncbi:MAG: hypothetical protein ACYTF0_04720 [Planctomycetota bacterium]|jgi:hypothetical protein